jgi:uncharacterized protein (TIGR02588 family)
MTRKKGGRGGGVIPRTAAEWVSLAIALLLVAGVIGVVAALWLNSSATEARFRIERGTIRNEAGQYYLPITIINEGDETGAQVTVEGRLEGAGGEEKAATTFDFIPAHSRAEAVLIFTAEPGSAAVRVISYQQP